MPTDMHTLASQRRVGDVLLLGVVWVLFFYSLALAPWHGTWFEALAFGLPLALATSALVHFFQGTVLSRNVIAACFMLFSALTIHQAHGMIEMHFAIFVLLATLLYYRDWTPIVTAAVVTALHHVLGHMLHESGAPIHVFNHDHMGFGAVVVHAAFVVFEASMLVLFAIRLRREAVQADEVRDFTTRLAASDQEIDLSFRMDEERSDLAPGLNQFMDALSDLVLRASTATSQLNTAIRELVQHADDTGQALARQGDDTVQTRQAVTRSMAATEQIAERAARAAEVADEGAGRVRDGRTLIEESERTATRLSDVITTASGSVEALVAESDNIGGVLAVIREVAEQTNLLALNAAIEAARAGEQGRGFAVVADEVRTLATRTQESAGEIERMVGRLQDGAREAAETMGESRTFGQHAVTEFQQIGVLLNDFAQAITTINALNAEIATATEEQSTDAREVGDAVARIEEQLRVSATAADTVARSSETLTQLAEGLETTVRRFRIPADWLETRTG